MSQFSKEQLEQLKQIAMVTCADGTKDISNGKNPPCIKNGGVKNDWKDIGKILSNQDFPDTSNVKYSPEPVVNAPTKGKEDITKKLLGAYNQNLIIAVVLVAGYFAYKKFKK